MTWDRWFPRIFLFSCFEGFISNLLFPAKLPLLYRDLLVFGVYLLFWNQQPASRWISRLRRAVGSIPWLFAVCFLWVGIWQLFNPSTPNIIVSLLGFKVIFFYWPLAVLGYAYAAEPEKVRRFFKAIVYFSIPINLFGLYQFWLGPDFLIQLGPGFERAVIEVGFREGVFAQEISFLRIIGTFASTGQYAGFLVVNAALIFSLILTANKPRERWLLPFIAVLNFLALVATGSRGGLVLQGLTLLVGIFFSPEIKRSIWIIFLVALSLYLGLSWMGRAVVKRFESLEDIEMVEHRSTKTTPALFMKVLREHPMGKGLGTGSSATRHFVKDKTDLPLQVENHPSKLQLETGIFGVIFFYLFISGLALRWIARWRKPLDLFVTSLLGPISAYGVSLILLSFIMGGFDSPSQAVFFWALVGIVARLANPEASTP